MLLNTVRQHLRSRLYIWLFLWIRLFYSCTFYFFQGSSVDIDYMLMIMRYHSRLRSQAIWMVKPNSESSLESNWLSFSEKNINSRLSLMIAAVQHYTAKSEFSYCLFNAGLDLKEIFFPITVCRFMGLDCSFHLRLLSVLNAVLWESKHIPQLCFS